MYNYKQKYLKYKQKYIQLKKKQSDVLGGEYLKINDPVIKYIKEKSLVIHSEANSDENLSNYNSESLFYGLDISMSFEDIKTIFNQRNYIQLRPH
jgi:hypothetical protein